MKEIIRTELSVNKIPVDLNAFNWTIRRGGDLLGWRSRALTETRYDNKDH